MAEQSNNPVMKFLLGKWLGHPLHPAVVHIPIALWLGALFFDVLSLCNVGGNAVVRGAYWAILAGLASTLIVVPAGFAEWSQIKRAKPAWTLALWHMIFNLTTAALFAISLYFRSGDNYAADRVPIWPFVLCIAANVLLLVSGYLGGRMVYDQGIAVARMSKKKWRSLAAAGHNNLPPES